MLIPEPFAADWTSFWYTPRASTLIQRYQAYETRIEFILENLRWFEQFRYLRITGRPQRFRPMEQFCRHMKQLDSTFGNDLNWKYLQGVNWLYLDICREKFALLWKNLGLFLSNRIYELHILLQLLINTTTVQIVLSTLC